MGRIKLSKEAAMKVIRYSEEAKEKLMTNVNVMDSGVNSQFSGLQDPTLKKYLELSSQMQDLFKQIGTGLDAVSEYCRSVARFIDEYNEI